MSFLASHKYHMVISTFHKIICSSLLSNSSSSSLRSSDTSSLHHQVLDGEGAADATSFAGALLHPIPSSHLIEHHIPRDHHLASLGIIEPIGLAALLMAQQHHGRASVFQLAEVGLCVLDMANAQKSNVLPIRCDELEISTIQSLLPCPLSTFPCKYLGVPLSLRKLTKDQVQPFVDRIADRLPGWKAELMTRAGRRVLVQFVLTGMLIYLAMAIDLPPWAIKAVDKIRRGFLWRGRRDAKGGHCLVAWVKACRPLELGGLGISDLKSLGWSLRMRWLWLQKTEPHRPWTALPFHVPEQVRVFFSMAVTSIIGDGANTLFWTDRWLNGQCIADLAPRLFAAIPKRRVKKRTVQDALSNRSWILDIQGARTVGVIVDFLHLWDLLLDFQLQPEIEDRHIWRFSSNGQYSAKSAYDGFFLGSTVFGPWERIWKSWSPPKCRFFMWLVAHSKCWTADR